VAQDDADPTPPWDWRRLQKDQANSRIDVKWTEVGSNESTTFYVDLATIRSSKNIASLWNMLDLQTPDFSGNDPYLSMVNHTEFNCKAREYRFLISSNYSQNMGAGEMVYRNQHKSVWTTVPERSAINTFWKTACGKFVAE